jgi:dTDP-4-amino-4,6-dideoxygalactose transaminase
MPVAWDLARQMAGLLDAPLIADVAQGHGASWRNAPVGATADLIVLSFGRGKGWTGAGGGALLWRDAAGSADNLVPGAVWEREVERKGREASRAVAAASQFLFGRSASYGIPAAIPFLRLGETVYHAPTTPRPIARTSAALLLANDEASMREVWHRRNNAAQYTRTLNQAGGSVTGLPGARLDASAGALRYPVRVKGGWIGVRAAGGVLLGAAPTYPTTLQDLTALHPLLEPGLAQAPGARLLVDELITLPTHSQTTAAERLRLMELLTGRAH